MIEEHFFQDRDGLFSALLPDCQQNLQSALAARQRASLLVSGGSTPKPLYQQLSQSTFDWSRIDIALVDERWVEPGTPGSNQTFIADNLLQYQAANAHYIPSKTSHLTAQQGLSQCEDNYQQLQRPFDLVILGMGPDAHTASLFPHADNLAAALDAKNTQLCAALTVRPSAVTGEFVERMTLTLHGLMQARQLHLLITGDDKLAVYQQAKREQDYLASPISAVLNQNQVPVKVYWAP